MKNELKNDWLSTLSCFLVDLQVDHSGREHSVVGRPLESVKADPKKSAGLHATENGQRIWPPALMIEIVSLSKLSWLCFPLLSQTYVDCWKCLACVHLSLIPGAEIEVPPHILCSASTPFWDTKGQLIQKKKIVMIEHNVQSWSLDTSSPFPQTDGFSFLFFFNFFLFFFFLSFVLLWPHPWHMEVLRLGVQSEL